MLLNSTRRQRLLTILAAVALLGAVAALALLALRDNVSLYYTPSEVAAGKAPQGAVFRVGGLVAAGSLRREPASLAVSFVITDGAHSLPVRYQGILPDLFRENRGAVVQGHYDGRQFSAQEVLAKHDENYMPPPAADALRRGRAGAETQR